MILFIAACANQQPITGGPRDETPPQLISSVPANQSTNYQGNTILLEFDEFVTAQDLKKELIITPFTDVTYTHKVRKGHFVEVKLDSALDENTTYTFNFRKAVADITEKNEAENLKLAFSTGDVIDSLTIAGTVTDLLTGAVVDDASVILFAADDTLTIDGGRPLYLSKTNESGEYLIENLKQAEYQLMVIKEEDGNLEYNKPEEQIGFLAQNIQLDSNYVGVDVVVTEYDYKELKLISGRERKQYFEFKFNKLIEDFELSFTDSAWSSKIYAKNTGEVIRLFNGTQAVTDSFEIRLQAKDLVGNEIDTTRYIQFTFTGKPAKESFSKREEPASAQEFLRNDSLRLKLTFSKPVFSIQNDSVMQILAVNDTTIDTTLWQVEPAITAFATVLDYPAQVVTGPLTYDFPRGSFVSVEGDTLEAFQLKYGIYNEENYGVVYGKIETLASSFTIQLMAEGKVEQEIKNETDFKFRFVKPGNKSIRILIDENEDGIWDIGDYKTRVLPEKVYFYSSPIPVKPNWELETELIKF
ncbi:MAG: Ig-like domain-containing protein [Flammeovirgaceae bacterium]